MIRLYFRRIVKYKESLKNKILDYQRNFDLPLQYVKASNIRFGPVCDTKFVPSKELNGNHDAWPSKEGRKYHLS